MDLGEDEYANQLVAWSLLDCCEVRIPQPYRFVKTSGPDGISCGHLIMESIPGQCLDSPGFVMSQDVLERVARAVYLHSKSLPLADESAPPGPITGSLARGFPWEDDFADVEFFTIDDLERCLISPSIRSS